MVVIRGERVFWRRIEHNSQYNKFDRLSGSFKLSCFGSSASPQSWCNRRYRPRLHCSNHLLRDRCKVKNQENRWSFQQSAPNSVFRTTAWRIVSRAEISGNNGSISRSSRIFGHEQSRISGHEQKTPSWNERRRTSNGGVIYYTRFFHTTRIVLPLPACARPEEAFATAFLGWSEYLLATLRRFSRLRLRQTNSLVDRQLLAKSFLTRTTRIMSSGFFTAVTIQLTLVATK